MVKLGVRDALASCCMPGVKEPWCSGLDSGGGGKSPVLEKKTLLETPQLTTHYNMIENFIKSSRSEKARNSQQKLCLS